MKVLFLTVTILFFVSCEAESSELEPCFDEPVFLELASPYLNGELSRHEIPVETFSNATKIGRARKNKIVIDLFDFGMKNAFRADQQVVIKFYTLSNVGKWQLKQSLEVDSESLPGLQTQISDFNNDGLKDVTFVSGNAVRGGNQIRTLLIYDEVRDELVRVRNSNEYPNLVYNNA